MNDKVNEMKECRMEMVEDSDFNITWECSCCGKSYKDTDKFLKSKKCKSCDSTIIEFVGLYDEEEEE